MREERQFYINGKWTDPIDGKDFPVIDPSTEEPCATISLGGQADAEAAIAAAKSAFASWSLSTKQERLDLLRSILDVYTRNSDAMGEAISREMGAPIDMAKASQSGSGTEHIQDFINTLEAFEFEGEKRPGTPNDRMLREPIGVCSLITPWN